VHLQTVDVDAAFDCDTLVITPPSSSKTEPVPLKSNRVPTSRLAWSVALATSCVSTSDTISKDGIVVCSLCG
jgi:hypothetical protein